MHLLVALALMLRGGPSCQGWPARSLGSHGTIAAHGMIGRYDEQLDTSRGDVVQHWTMDGFSEAAGSNGGTEWTQDRSGTSHPMDSAHARAVGRTDAWLDARGWCLSDARGARGAPVTGTRSFTESGRTYDVMRVVPTGGVPAEVWFERLTGLLDRTIVRLNEDTRAIHFSDWRQAAGTNVAFLRRIVYVEDDDVVTLRTQSVSNVDADPSAFALPAQAHNFEMARGVRSTTVPIRIEGRKILVDVLVNGRGPFPFVFDTGGHFIVTANLAKQLGLTVAGVSSGPKPEYTDGFARVRELRIGDAIVRNDVAHVIPYSFSRLERGPRQPKAGWLGLELLVRFSVVIDPAAKTLTLTPLAQATTTYAGVRVPIVLDQDAPLVDCRIDGLPGQCMIDTGNASPTIVEGYWANANGLKSRFTGGINVGDGIRIARASVDVGAIHLPHEIVVSYPREDSGSESTTVEAGILSETLHERCVTSIDYAQGAMWLAPVAEQRVPLFSRTGLFLKKNRDGTFEVDTVLAHSPASAAGLREGDRIVAIDGKPASAYANADVIAGDVAPVGTIRTYRVLSAKTGTSRTAQLRLAELLP
jgi:hypothetical protein